MASNSPLLLGETSAPSQLEKKLLEYLEENEEASFQELKRELVKTVEEERSLSFLIARLCQEGKVEEEAKEIPLGKGFIYTSSLRKPATS